MGSDPEGLAIDSTNGNVYVADTGANNVSVISGVNITMKEGHKFEAQGYFIYLPHFIISVETANAHDLAQELGQTLLIKKLAKEAFVVKSFESHAIIEFSNVQKDFVDIIDAEIADWLTHKHSTMKKRKLNGLREKLSLNISDQTNEELVCIELRPALRK